MNGYFEQLFEHLKTEFNHNMEHLENYLNFPRNQTVLDDKKKNIKTREIISNMDGVDGESIKGCRLNLSLK